jgi:hypothetical protein
MTLTERAGGLLLTRARRGGLTATMAAACSAALSTTLASWAGLRFWNNGCFSVKDEEDDDDKDDDQDTKKQHSTKWRHSVPTPLSRGVDMNLHVSAKYLHKKG